MIQAYCQFKICLQQSFSRAIKVVPGERMTSWLTYGIAAAVGATGVTTRKTACIPTKLAYGMIYSGNHHQGASGLRPDLGA
jgi:hypothetical protein